MKSLQRTAQTSARAPEDAAGCPDAALQFMLSRGCNYRLHYWISLWKSAIAPQIITPIHGGGLRSAQREWPRGRRIGGTLRRVTRSGTCSATTTKPPPASVWRSQEETSGTCSAISFTCFDALEAEVKSYFVCRQHSESSQGQLLELQQKILRPFIEDSGFEGPPRITISL